MVERAPHPRGKIIHEVSQAEHDTIVAALRLYQDLIVARGISYNSASGGWTLSEPVDLDWESMDQHASDAIDTACSNGAPLDAEEINLLCERLRR